MTGRALTLCAALTLLSACAARHHAPIVDRGSKVAEITGTISGIVSADSAARLSGRRVTAVDTTTGMTYSATTSTTGGYTIQVPAGHTYRLDVELRAGETLSKKPDPTKVNASDLDEARDFVVTAGK